MFKNALFSRCLTLIAVLTCVAEAVAGGPSVTAEESEIVLPWYTSSPVYETEPRRNNALFPREQTKHREGERTIGTVVLENEYLRVVVAPELGGAVVRTIYKPTDEDMFFFEGKIKDWLPYWESGVKVCFPYREHSTAMTGQAASYRLVHGDDGSVTLAMWMEFSRHDEPWQRAMFGHYSNMLLSQHVTLRPDDSSFEITYRLVNPMPYRQGRRLWTDALFPRNHTGNGVVQGPATQPATTSEWIFPATYVSGHLAKDIRKYTEADRPLANTAQPHNAVFALDMPYGFTGLWYPEVRVNRLRLHDPAAAPAAKQYWKGEGTFHAEPLAAHTWNFAELFGGSDHVMEGVEHWIEPGEVYEFSHRYVMVKGIGRADFANDFAALHIEGGESPLVEVVTYQPVEDLRLEVDGESIAAARLCGPTQPATFPLPRPLSGERVVLRGGDWVIVDQVFPLPMPDERSGHEAIVAASELGSPEGNERVNDQQDHGRSVEKAAQLYPAGSLGLGRVQLRLGRLEAARATLEHFTTAHPEEGEGWHLLGVTLLELRDDPAATSALERALDAELAYPPAGYLLALQHWKAGERDAAMRRLQRLLERRPNHWEARLMQAWWGVQSEADHRSSLAAARRMAEEDPADPRAVLVLWLAKRLSGHKEKARQARSDLDKLLLEEGAGTRLNEFVAACTGTYLPPKRIQLFENPE